MKRMMWLLAALAFLGAAGRARAGVVVVNFDDLSGSGVVSNGYGGINWSGHWDYYGFAQPPYNAQSGPNRVYTDNGTGLGGVAGENTFSFLSPAVFQGAYFAGYSFAAVNFNLYYHNVLVGTSTSLAPSSTPTFLASGYSGLVDMVGVYSLDNDYYVMDNVTYLQPERAGAPEPASLTLLGVGAVAGALGCAWGRRRAAAAA
jgi:hypothetical protein